MSRSRPFDRLARQIALVDAGTLLMVLALILWIL